MPKILSTIALLSIFAAAAPSADEVYRSVDEEGKVTFSDKPGENSEKVEVEIKNVQEALPLPAKAPRQAAEETVQYQVRLSSPGSGETLGPTVNTLTLSASVSPAMDSKHRLNFYLDGSLVAGPQRQSSTSLPLTLKMRGRHSAQVTLVDANGKTLATSETATFHVIRP